jgi:hypothetical protein
MSEIVTVRMSGFDRLLNIHQSIKLSEIEKLNRESLNQQIKQNAQLSVLSEELKLANTLTKQILQNQIGDLKRKEEQRFYKSLAFNCHEIIEKIEKIENLILKAYFIQTYEKKIKLNLVQAKETLEDIEDKIEVKKYIERCELLYSDSTRNNDFINSSVYRLNEVIDDYQIIEKQLSQSLNELGNRIKSIKIPNEGIFGFNKKARVEALEQKSQLENEFNKKTEEKVIVLNQHSLNALSLTIKEQYAELDTIAEEIMLIENAFKNKFETKIKLDLDPIFIEAAKIIVLHQDASTSLLQRKLKLGYSHAGVLMNQLESAGVISKSRELLIKDSDSLSELLKKI